MELKNTGYGSSNLGVFSVTFLKCRHGSVNMWRKHGKVITGRQCLILGYNRILKIWLFTKCYIPTNFDMMESWDVYPEGFGEFTVSDKYYFLSRRIQFGFVLFRSLYIYLETKYLEMAHFRFISCIHLFRSIKSKSTVR